MRTDRDRPPSGDEDVRKLLEEAGARPEVPAADLALSRAAARAEWERVVAPARRRRSAARWLVPVAAGLAVIVVAGVVARLGPAGGSAGARETLATVTALRGEVVASPADGGGASGLAAGRALAAGTTIETGAGATAGRLTLAWAGGGSLRLDAGSRARLVSASEIELAAGAIYVDSGEAGGAPLEIATALGRVRELGTQFEVRLGAGRDSMLTVSVRQGSVGVSRAAAAHEVAAGERLSLAGDGTVARSRVARHGAPWSWVLEAAPTFEIEGRSLAQLLAWVGRETGWRVSYEDPALAAAAGEIRLHGTIEGLRPDRAVEVVLPGAGLEHRLEDGVLVIVRPVRTPR
jgi:ferric-dicitrate binding protein FerR (iron transport regulator)